MPSIWQKRAQTKMRSLHWQWQRNRCHTNETFDCHIINHRGRNMCTIYIHSSQIPSWIFISWLFTFSQALLLSFTLWDMRACANWISEGRRNLRNFMRLRPRKRDRQKAVAEATKLHSTSQNEWNNSFPFRSRYNLPSKRRFYMRHELVPFFWWRQKISLEWHSFSIRSLWVINSMKERKRAEMMRNNMCK